jgi:hypothetical protein
VKSEEEQKKEDEKYRCLRAGCGYYTFEVESYKVFIHDIAPMFVRSRRDAQNEGKKQPYDFIWRGFSDPAWPLQSSLSRFASREVKSTGDKWQEDVCRMTIKHLIEFIEKARGLGLLNRAHDSLRAFLIDQSKQPHKSFLEVLLAMELVQRDLTYELFGLGQHEGLLTPFMDWTSIPLMALYFAFSLWDSRPDGVGYRVVFALNKTHVEESCSGSEVADVSFLGSMAHDNHRIIAQSGLFTFAPAHLPLDQWVVSKAKINHEVPVLIRFLIRNANRLGCLDELAASGIHARSVFPDRFGAAMHTNFLLESSASAL